MIPWRAPWAFAARGEERRRRLAYVEALHLDPTDFADADDVWLQPRADHGAPRYQFSPYLQPDGRRSEEKAMEKINLALTEGPAVF